MGIEYRLVDDDLRECFDLEKCWEQDVPLPTDAGEVEAYVASAGKWICDDPDYRAFVTRRLVEWLEPRLVPRTREARWGHRLRVVGDYADDESDDYHVTSGRYATPSHCCACDEHGLVVCSRWEATMEEFKVGDRVRMRCGLAGKWHGRWVHGVVESWKAGGIVRWTELGGHVATPLPNPNVERDPEVST